MKGRWEKYERTQRCEEPPVLSASVSVLEDLLDRLLGILALRNLLESVRRNNTLETLEFERVSRRHEVVVVYHLDEGLDLGSLLLAGLRHAAGDLGGVSLDASYDGVAELVRLLAIVDGLKDDDLQKKRNGTSAFHIRQHPPYKAPVTIFIQSRSSLSLSSSSSSHYVKSSSRPWGFAPGYV